MPSACVSAELIEEAAARRRRHEALFNAIAQLDRTVEEIWFANVGRIRLHGPGQRVLAVLFGKATKSLDAIRLLCETGFGQDAVILTRSLVNLVINVWYIGSAPDPDERALDYNASGWMAQRRFFANFPRRTVLPEPPDLAEIEGRARRWDAVTILDTSTRQRAPISTTRTARSTASVPAWITRTPGAPERTTRVRTVRRSRSTTRPTTNTSRSLSGTPFRPC